jgi:adenine-specific DNA-methyltransferase
MPTLNWIGKDKIVNHDKEVSFRLLRKNQKLSLGKSSENLIVEGDNLEALKALMPFYYGKVKCIYIDPPYNTGNEGWVYNDRVNAPKIKEWLGKVVGAEGEDLSRHDKWLCMMYPRLKLLRDLLREDGVIFVSIDDNEHCDLRMAMDEIFGEENFISNIIWQKKYAASNDAKYFSDNHDFVVCYAKNKNDSDKDGWVRNLLPRTDKQNSLYKYDSKDGRGLWRPDNLTVKTYSAAYDYPILNPITGKKYNPTKGRSWLTNKETVQRWIMEGRIFFGKDGKGAPQLKRYLNEVQAGIVPLTVWLYDEVGHTDEARKELKEVFQSEKFPFDNPKPTRLIKKILQVATNKEDIILDSFAGSGTTAHAVLDLNKEDGGNRKFILVELEKKIAREITSERVRRVAKDLGGGFEYMELDGPLFDERGNISPGVDFDDLAKYIYFTETHTSMGKAKGNYLGEFGGVHYFLFFDGIGGNVLNKKSVAALSKISGPKVVYADKSLLDEATLVKYQITFKQIPYEIKIY